MPDSWEIYVSWWKQDGYDKQTQFYAYSARGLGRHTGTGHDHGWLGPYRIQRGDKPPMQAKNLAHAKRLAVKMARDALSKS